MTQDLLALKALGWRDEGQSAQPCPDGQNLARVLAVDRDALLLDDGAVSAARISAQSRTVAAHLRTPLLGIDQDGDRPDRHEFFEFDRQ